MANVTFVGTSSSWHGKTSNQSKYKEITQQIADLFDQEVIIHLTHSNTIPVSNLASHPSEKHIINFWSRIEGIDQLDSYIVENPPEKLWEHEYHNDGLLKPTGKGKPITSPEGVVVAEYFPEYNMTFILFDIQHLNTSAEIKIYKEIITDLQKLLLNGQDLDTFLKAQRDKKREANLVRFREQVANNAKVQIDSYKHDIQNAERKIEDYKKQIMNQTNLLLTARLNLEMHEQNFDKVVEKIVQELLDLPNNPKITEINFVEDGWFEFHTTELYINHKEKTYLVGRYQIKIKLNDGTVLFLNKDAKNKRKGYWGEGCHHPHVNTHGTACLGNLAPMIAELIPKNEWTILAQVLINFLESVNADDPAGAKITAWDVVSKPKQAKPTTEPIPVVPENITTELVSCVMCGNTIPHDRSFHGLDFDEPNHKHYCTQTCAEESIA